MSHNPDGEGGELPNSVPYGGCHNGHGRFSSRLAKPSCQCGGSRVYRKGLRLSQTIELQRPSARSDPVKLCGFHLHASVRIAASDDRSRDRLFRYCQCPTFSLDRLHLLPDGRIGYHVKKSGRRASRVRMMTPVECLAGLCALIPPPFLPFTRFHGVIAPRSKPRKAILVKPPRDVTAS
ncbi:MAG: transposase [Polyangiaceae bacterium]|nr:transposase [Polyangiaceae bacterium]